MPPFPVLMLIALGLVLLAQVSLAVVALVDLYRRPAATVTTGNKWIWAAIVALISFVGPVLYLAIGRRPAGAVDRPLEQQRSSADIADDLYGTSDAPTSP